MAFIIDTDYDMQIKAEIKALLDTSNDLHALKRAEDTAMSQIRKYLSGRFDMSQIFIDASDPDLRDQFIVTITIDITLYHLYSKTPHRDIPTHRANRYQDALNWLRDAGTGELATDLPIVTNPDGTQSSTTRLWSKTIENHKW